MTDKNTKNEVTHYTVPWPTMCEQCGQDLARRAIENKELNVFVAYCPHTFTLTLAYAGELNGSRGIVRWDVESPMSQDEAIEAINKMAPHAEVMVNLDQSKLQ